MSHLLHIILAVNQYAISPDGIAPTGTTTIGEGITKIIKLLMTLIGMLSIVFIIVGGIQMTLSTGNAAHVKSARETVIYAVVGLVVAISAYALVSFITGRL